MVQLTDFVVRFSTIEFVVLCSVSPPPRRRDRKLPQTKTSNDVDFIYDNDNLFLQFYVSICPSQETTTSTLQTSIPHPNGNDDDPA